MENEKKSITVKASWLEIVVYGTIVTMGVKGIAAYRQFKS